MRRGFRAVAVGVLAALMAGLLPMPVSQAGAREESADAAAWAAIRDQAVDRFEAMEGPAETPHALASMAQVTAWTSPDGWADPAAVAYLDRVRALKNPDGGWGIGKPHDVASDGTVNPASTSYTITMTDHVGPVMLDAYRAGAATRAEVQAIVTWVMGVPYIQSANSQYGQCVAYSKHPNDQASYQCIHNANASVAAWLTSAIEAGIGASGAQKRVVEVVRRETYAYLPMSPGGRPAWWRYMDTTYEQDVDHNGAMADMLYGLTYPVAREAAYQVMAGAVVDGSAPLAYARIAGMPGGPGSMATDGSGTTLWCQMARTWTDEVAAYVTTAESRTAAQIAYWAARAARSCAAGQP